MNYFARELSTFREASGTAFSHAWTEPEPPGIIRQYGGALVHFGLLLDSAIVVGALVGFARMAGVEARDELILGLIGVCSFGIIASSLTLYRSYRMVSLRAELGSVALAWIVGFALTWTVSSMLSTGPERLLYAEGAENRLLLLGWFASALAGMSAYRVALRLGLRYYRAKGHDRRRVAFIGDTAVSRRLALMFRKNAWMGVDVVGCCDDDVEAGGTQDWAPRLRLNDVLLAARQQGLSAIYISLPMAEQHRIKTIIELFSDTTVSIYYCPPLFEFDPVNAHWGDVNGDPVISIVESPFSGLGRRHLKRAEDLVLASAILIVVAPLLVATFVAVRLTSPGPALFRQKRYGLDGREFTMLKFRTMYVEPEGAKFVQATRNDPRVTPLGAILRKTSIDELPQLINVLLGDMSVIGPRPHPVQLNESHRKLIPRYMLRHIVKPGVTGLAQVNGYRGETETVDLMRKRVEYDLKYIKEWSIILDLYILVRTFFVGFAGSRAY